MDWVKTKLSFESELEKIAEISLMGFSPEVALGARVQQPIETPGLKKAKDVLSRAKWHEDETSNSPMMESSKIASRQHPKTFTSYANAAAAGASAGVLLSSLIPPAKGGSTQMMRGQYRNRLMGAGLGALLSLANKALTKQTVKTAMTTPALSLRGSQKVGTLKHAVKSGPKISTQIRGSLTGHKGTIPGV